VFGADAGVARVNDFRLTRNIAAQNGDILKIYRFYILRAKIALAHILKRDVFRFYLVAINVYFRERFFNFAVGSSKRGSGIGALSRRRRRTARPRAELNPLADDFRRPPVLPLVVLPSAGLEPPFHHCQTSFLQELIDDFRLPAPDNDIVKLDILLLLARFIGPNPVRCKRNSCNRLAGWRGSELRISREPSD